MPTYDYRCRGCGHEFELFQSMSDKPKRTCPSCKKAKLERLIGTGAAVLFKGSGFYETDYRSESYKKAAEAESKPTTDTKDVASGKPVSSDTKPATTDAAPAKSEPAKDSSVKPRKRAASTPTRTTHRKPATRKK